MGSLSLHPNADLFSLSFQVWGSTLFALDIKSVAEVGVMDTGRINETEAQNPVVLYGSLSNNLSSPHHHQMSLRDLGLKVMSTVCTE